MGLNKIIVFSKANIFLATFYSKFIDPGYKEGGWVKRGGGVGDLPLPPIQHTSAREVLFGVSE